MNNLANKIAGIFWQNPFSLASGTAGFGEEYAAWGKPSQLGAFFTKGLTLEPRVGNPPPRIVETPAGMLNTIGLQNPGLAVFLKEHFFGPKAKPLLNLSPHQKQN